MAEKTKILIWTKEYSVGVKELDDQHKELISIVNEMYEAVESAEVNINVIGDILKKIAAFADYHFATEEKYFDEFNYAFKEEHKAEHRKLKDEIARLSEMHRLQDISVFVQLISFLNGWIEEHLMHQDMKYVRCFREHGLKSLQS
jgi:hemerythrin-like metal-binding protein